jgi:hypothetical protein
MSKIPRLMKPNWIAAGICAALLVLFTGLAWFAISTKSPTFDEVYHAPAAWIHLWQHDYRIDFENPPLWKYWAALPNGRDALKADFNSPTWRDEPNKMYLQWWWCVRTLFETPGNQGVQFINRSRAMMLIANLVLGALIAWWAWRIRGPIAAIFATALFSLDPNFLAHSALVKNDVAFALSVLALMYALWRAGQNLTWPRLLLVSLLGGLMLNIKLSGVVVAALIPIMLALRVTLPGTWEALGSVRKTVWQKSKPAILTALISAAISFTMIWADYGFRFAPTPDPEIRLNVQELVHAAKRNELRVRQGAVTEEQVDTAQPSLSIRAVLFANDHRLLPHAWLMGLLYQYASSLFRTQFFWGMHGSTGWWYYFPFAMLVKTPVATLLAAALSLLVAWREFRFSELRESNRLWTILCLLTPAAFYMTSAMHSNLNIGLRHIFPVYPFIFIAIGCIASIAWTRWRWRASWPIFGCVLLLAIETFSAFPNYISFFNFAAGGSPEGIHLLADSNLDWGQDLPLLARWQQNNPQPLLYLSYFGAVDPQYYGIKYIPLKGGFQFDKNPTLPSVPGILAVSASNLQGVFVNPEVTDFYKSLLDLRPMNVLGGSIYLFRWPPQPADVLRTSSDSIN